MDSVKAMDIIHGKMEVNMLEISSKGIGTDMECGKINRKDNPIKDITC